MLEKVILQLPHKMPILIMASKFDLKHSKPAHEIYNLLDIEKLSKLKYFEKGNDKKKKSRGIDWCIQSYSSVSGAGIVEGLSWLLRCFHPVPSDICFYCRDTNDIVCNSFFFFFSFSLIFPTKKNSQKK